MRQDTIGKINRRLELAQARHGKFRNAEHMIDTLRMETLEAAYAQEWQSRDHFISELLDVATVAIRAAEQFSSAETGAEAANKGAGKMPYSLLIPSLSAMGPSDECGTVFAVAQTPSMDYLMVIENHRNKEIEHQHYSVEQARLIRDWLNQFIEASEAEK